MLRISQTVSIPPNEIEVQAVRSSGPGGQNVNKTASAAHLFFDVRKSSLPEHYKNRLLAQADQRLTQDGVIVIKAQESRSLEKNRQEALERLADMIRAAGATRKRRRPTRPSRNARAKRVESKKKTGRNKMLRGRVRPDY